MLSRAPKSSTDATASIRPSNRNIRQSRTFTLRERRPITALAHPADRTISIWSQGLVIGMRFLRHRSSSRRRQPSAWAIDQSRTSAGVFSPLPNGQVSLGALLSYESTVALCLATLPSLQSGGTPARGDIDSVIDVRAVSSTWSSRAEPRGHAPVPSPTKGRTGSRQEKCFCPD